MVYASYIKYFQVGKEGIPIAKLQVSKSKKYKFINPKLEGE